MFGIVDATAEFGRVYRSTPPLLFIVITLHKDHNKILYRKMSWDVWMFMHNEDLSSLIGVWLGYLCFFISGSVFSWSEQTGRRIPSLESTGQVC